MGITSKIKTVYWYLKNPGYHRALLQLIGKKLSFNNKEKTRSEAEKWCSNHSIATKLAFEKILGSYKDHMDVRLKYPDVFEAAEKAADQSPVKMGGPGDIDLLYHFAEGISAKSIIETGVAYGWSSLALLLSLKEREGHLISTDMPYAKLGNEDYVGCVIPENLKSYWTLIRKPDVSGLPEAFKVMESFDLCHYDSDKSYEGRMWAYPKLWERLKQGGIFVSDDIGDNLAFKDFSESINQKPTIVKFHNQFVGVLTKN